MFGRVSLHKSFGRELPDLITIVELIGLADPFV
jgi:hypothetical protein